MTLSTRLSLFFLAALALVLAGFSGALYALAHLYLFRQADERCRAGLDVLHAAVEIEDGAAAWDPQDRRLSLNGDGGEVWAVFDDRGRLQDGAGAGPLSAEEQPDGPEDVRWQGQWWRRARRWVRPDAALRRPNDPRPRALLLTVAVPLGPVHAALRTLALWLGGLSLAAWAAAALAGRRLCRRALAPLTRMAQAAHGIGAADLTRRLPVPSTGDELKGLAEAFNDLLARLEEAFARQRRFTAEASHQLRTPLTALRGQAEVALRRERPPQEYRTALESVRGQAERLQRLVEMLLFLARADAESAAPERERIDLGDWLRGHLASWDGHARRGDLREEIEAQGPLSVRTHAALLGQALDNVLDNACKYSAPGSPIVLRLRREKGELLLAVEDRGCGVSEQDLAHVFEPFFRSAEARRRGVGGVGLGLAVAARIVAALGGRVEAHSREGEGSRFVLALPEHESANGNTPGCGSQNRG
jgi:heavy metal sensor kinase